MTSSHIDRGRLVAVGGYPHAIVLDPDTPRRRHPRHSSGGSGVSGVLHPLASSTSVLPTPTSRNLSAVAFRHSSLVAIGGFSAKGSPVVFVTSIPPRGPYVELKTRHRESVVAMDVLGSGAAESADVVISGSLKHSRVVLSDSRNGKTLTVVKRGKKGSRSLPDDILCIHTVMTASSSLSRGFAVGGSSTPPSTYGNTVYLYDCSAGRSTVSLLRRLEGHKADVCGLSQDLSRGTLLSSSLDQTLRVWDAKQSGSESDSVGVLKLTGLGLSVGVAEEENRVFVGLENGCVEAFDSRMTIRRLGLFRPHPGGGGVHSMARLSRETFASVCMEKNVVATWMTNGKLLRGIRTRNWNRAVCYSHARGSSVAASRVSQVAQAALQADLDVEKEEEEAAAGLLGLEALLSIARSQKGTKDDAALAPMIARALQAALAPQASRQIPPNVGSVTVVSTRPQPSGEKRVHAVAADGSGGGDVVKPTVDVDRASLMYSGAIKPTIDAAAYGGEDEGEEAVDDLSDFRASMKATVAVEPASVGDSPLKPTLEGAAYAGVPMKPTIESGGVVYSGVPVKPTIDGGEAVYTGVQMKPTIDGGEAVYAGVQVKPTLDGGEPVYAGAPVKPTIDSAVYAGVQMKSTLDPPIAAYNGSTEGASGGTTAPVEVSASTLDVDPAFSYGGGVTLAEPKVEVEKESPVADAAIEVSRPEWWIDLSSIRLEGPPIGEGSFGYVRCGVLSRGREKLNVAVKVMSLQRSKKEDVVKEIELMASLSHDNVLTVFGGCFSDENGFMVMENCSFGNLAEYLQEERNLYTRLSLLVDVVHGMEYLHRKNIVHRDLKPENVLVDAEHQGRICDFGTSKKIEREDEDKGMIVGTAGYIPNPSREWTPKRHDVYSFGILAFEVLTGKGAYESVRSRLVGRELDVLREIFEKNLLPDVSEVPDVEDTVREVLRKSWCEDNTTFNDLGQVFRGAQMRWAAKTPAMVVTASSTSTRAVSAAGGALIETRSYELGSKKAGRGPWRIAPTQAAPRAAAAAPTMDFLSGLVFTNPDCVVRLQGPGGRPDERLPSAVAVAGGASASSADDDLSEWWEKLRIENEKYEMRRWAALLRAKKKKEKKKRRR